jgi:hypothetical protein
MTFTGIRAFWARVTGRDTGTSYPQQQGVAMGRTGAYATVSQYGFYCDLPDDTLLWVAAPGVAFPVSTSKPQGVARDEPTFFHPSAGSRITLKKDGSVEIDTGSKDVRLTGGDLIVNGVSFLSHVHTQGPDSGADIQATTNGPVGGSI